MAGTAIRMLALAGDDVGCIGVDLETGAFMRASHPRGVEAPQPLDVVDAKIAGALEPPDAARPEAVELVEPPQVVGRMSIRRAERLLAPLHHPARLPLLGLAADAVPYWTLTGDRPSLALVELRGDARVRWGSAGPECHFVWQNVPHELPLVDARVIAILENEGLARPGRADLQSLLGYRPRLLLVMLTAPVDGYCHKAVGAMLPSGRG